MMSSYESSRKPLVLVIIVGLASGLLGAAVFSALFARTGPQGEPGLQGVQGLQGSQGSQGISGVNGTDAILQMLQNNNETEVDVSGYVAMQWFNMSSFDGSMKMTINVQQGSKLFVDFSSTNTMSAPASIWVKVVVDNNYNSSRYQCSLGPPSAGIFKIPGHIEFLTNSLNAGQHIIEVQFLREEGTVEIGDRILTVMELVTS